MSIVLRLSNNAKPDTHTDADKVFCQISFNVNNIRYLFSLFPVWCGIDGQFPYLRIFKLKLVVLVDVSLMLEVSIYVCVFIGKDLLICDLDLMTFDIFIMLMCVGFCDAHCKSFQYICIMFVTRRILSRYQQPIPQTVTYSPSLFSECHF